ncbi:MAG: ferrous iron transport protein A [Proteobacteria bacterium]|nr:ferrous iron transport protein A [Pseudomonadota bacterium]
MLRKEPAPGGTTLVQAPSGSRCRLLGTSAGQGLTSRLMAMGLLPGVEFMVQENQSGPVRLALGGDRLTLGRGAAEKILVEVLFP